MIEATKMAKEEMINSKLTLEIYAIKLEYYAKDKNEDDSNRRIIEMLEIKKRHKDVTIIDALRTIANSSLAEKIADEFEKVVKDKKRDYVVSMGCCAALYLGLDYTDFNPVIERVGQAISVMGSISAACLYYNASEAGKVVHYFLREKI